MRGYLAILAFLASAGAAHAQSTETYSYDQQGRLIGTAVTRTGASGGYGAYAYDRSDNRTAYNQQPVAAPAAANQLASGETIVAGQSLVSLDGRFHLTVRSDGVLALTDPGSVVLWSASSVGSNALTLQMQTDGNLALRNPASVLLWSSGTTAWPGGALTVQNDGDVVIIQGGVMRWHTNTGGH